MPDRYQLMESVTRLDYKHWLLTPTPELPSWVHRQSGKTVMTFNYTIIILGKNIIRWKYINLSRLMLRSPFWKLYVRIMNKRLAWWLRKFWWSY